MKDIARDLGIAVITVSKALRNHEDISEKTKKRVLDRVRELNYTPNLAARTLVTGKTHLVGLVVPDLLHTFFSQIAKSLSSEFLKRGYCLIISTSDEDPELEERTVNHLLARNLDLLIVASASANPAIFERIQKQGTPLILIDRCFPGLSSNYVGADDELVGELATRHLAEVGCKRIAHLRGPETSPGKGRLEGYLKTLAKFKMKSFPEYVSTQGKVDVHSSESGYDRMRQLLSLTPRPDGVFSYNDPMAIGAIRAILDAGLRVPEDIAVIGAGNLYYDTELIVPLSSIDQQTEQIGQRTSRLAFSLMESKTHPRNRTIIIQPQLVVRASSDRTRSARKRAKENSQKRA